MLYSGRIRVYINNIKDRYKAMTYYDFVAKLRINNRFIDNLSLHSSEKTKKNRIYFSVKYEDLEQDRLTEIENIISKYIEDNMPGVNFRISVLKNTNPEETQKEVASEEENKRLF